MSTEPNIIQIDHQSAYLKRRNKRCFVFVSKPTTSQEQGRASLPVFYFLHGWGGNGLSLLNTRGVTHCLKSFPGVYVFPESFRNWFINDHSNNLYETYFIRELIPLVENRFKAQYRLSNRVLLGYSMGGLAAFLLNARYRSLFSGVCCYAGAFSAPQRVGDPYSHIREADTLLLMPDEQQHERTWGPPGSVTRQRYDPFKLEPMVLNSMGFVYLSIGRQDFPRMREMNEQFHRYLCDHGVSPIYETYDGAHDLDFVARCLTPSLTQVFRYLNTSVKQLRKHTGSKQPVTL